jgi:hypothetical protein
MGRPPPSAEITDAEDTTIVIRLINRLSPVAKSLMLCFGRIAKHLSRRAADY